MEKINSLFPDNRDLEKTNVRKCHSVMFRVLRYLDYLCRKNKLKYWICGGTLIGAVIHKGWKPVGKDIDISLPKGDYEKLLGIVKENLLEGVELDVRDNTFFRIGDKKSKYTKGYFKGEGIGVDVYGIDIRKRLFWIYYKHNKMDEKD